MFSHHNNETLRQSHIPLSYTLQKSIQVPFYTGKNVLYCTRKGNSYALLDILSLQRTSGLKINIFTNNENILAKNKADKFVLSDKAIPNEKFIISKYLTSVFQSLPIKKRIRDKFYFCLRQLLMDKLVAI